LEDKGVSPPDGQEEHRKEPTYTAEEVRVLLELRSLQEWKGVVEQALHGITLQGTQLVAISQVIEKITETQEKISARLIAKTPEEAAAAQKGLQNYEQRQVLQKWLNSWRGKVVIFVVTLTGLIAAASTIINLIRNLSAPAR
jgi:hypothetical protein